MSRTLQIILRTLGRPRLVVFGLGLFFIYDSEVGFLSMKILEIAPETYKDIAVDLNATDGWRFGYVRLYHGAKLVKTLDGRNAIPFREQTADRKLVSTMSTQLRLVPAKVALECALYVTILWWVALGRHWILGTIYRKLQQTGWKVLLEGCAWILGWTIALFPLLTFGYGESLFTTWEGPGARTWLEAYVRITHIQGDTISYRSFVESFSVWPVLLVRDSGLGRYLPCATARSAAWVAGALFYGLIGFVCGVVQVLFAPRSRLGIKVGE